MHDFQPWLVVFDLDGTLIDSSLDLCLSVNAALAHVGAPELPHSSITGFIGDGAATLIRRALVASLSTQGNASPIEPHGPDLQQQCFHYFLAYYHEHKLDNTHLYDGVLSALNTIHDRRPDLPLAVLTNKPVHPSRDICEALGLSRYFFANYGGNSFPTKKPDPEGLLTVMAEARQGYSERNSMQETPSPGVVVIGDSETDVLTARRAGTRSIGCRYGLAPASLERTQPNLWCNAPSEWPVLLNLSR